MTKSETKFTIISAVVFLLILEIGFRIFFQPPRREILTELDPFVCFRLKSNLKNAKLWGTEVNTNSQGFRYQRDIPKSKPESTYRIFLLGGSTAVGVGASSEVNTFAVIAEKNLQKQTDYQIELINSAVPGYTSAQEMGLFLNKILDYNPDLIVIMDGFNDAYAPITSKEPGVPEPFIFFLQEYNSLNSFSHAMNVILGKSRMYQFFQSKIGARKKEHFSIGEELRKPEHHRAVGETYTRNIRSIATVAKSRNIPVKVFLQPAPGICAKKLSDEEADFFNNFWTKRVEGGAEYFKANYGELRSALERLQTSGEIAFFDMDSVFFGIETTIFTDQSHINDQGQKMIAEYITRKIIDCGYLNSSKKAKVKSQK